MANIAFDIRARARIDGARVAMRHKCDGRWLETTYAELDAAVAQLAAGLVRLGVARGDLVALFAPNMPAWTLCDLAVLSVGAVTVPVYVTSTAEQLAAIVEDSGARVLIAGTPAEAETAAALAAGRILILCEGEAPPSAPGAIALTALAEAASEPGIADELRRREDAARDEDLATIIYTSGTTGRPKGVMLSHHNILSNTEAVLKLVPGYREDLYLSFLPLSHAFERTVGYYLTMVTGSEVAFARSIPQLAEDFRNVRPTVIVSVPRIYERIYAAINAKLDEAPPIRRKLFNFAVDVGWDRFLHQHVAL
ncbi:AMP-binding protein, partial [bacterium]|nr:AMP-binding protein [bacterium]